MVQLRFREDTNNYFKFTVVALLFLLLAFDRDLAMVYLLILLGDWIWRQSDKEISFPQSRGPHTRLRVYMESVAALGLFLFVSAALVNVFAPQAIGGGIAEQTQSIFQLLSASTPILRESALLTLLGWGVLVPIIETSFFNGRLLEGLTTYAEQAFGKRISLQTFSVPLFGVMIVVAAMFTLFHITAKGIETLPLLITFIFSVVSSILVIRHQELKGAILLHILTNSAAVAAAQGYF